MTDIVALDPTALQRLRRIGGPDLVLKMLALFREAAPLRLAEARAGLAAGDLPAVQRAAHALISSAGNLGAAEMMAAARALEEAAGARGEAIGGELTALEAAYARLVQPLAEQERECRP